MWNSLATAFRRPPGGFISTVLGLVLLVSLVLLWLLGTERGRVSLTEFAVEMAGRFLPEYQIQVGEIGSDHWGAWYFSSLQVDYREEALVRARDLALDIDLFALSFKRINIETVDAAELFFDFDVLNRIIEAAPEAEDKPEDAGPISLPSMRLGSLRLGRLELNHAQVPDLPVLSLSADGRYLWRDEPAQLDFAVRELDGADLNITLTVKALEEDRYRIELAAGEKAGGFVGRRLLLPQGQALDVRGSILVQQLRQDRLKVEIEAFRAPLVGHQLSLNGFSEIELSPWKVSTEGIHLQVDESRHRISGNASAENVDAEIKLNKLPVDISRPWQEFVTGGWLSADLSVRGPLSSPSSLPSVSGVLDLNSNFRFSAESPAEPVRLQGRVQTHDQVIHIESATLSYADARLDAEGSVDIEGEALDLRGEILHMDLDKIRRLLAILPGTGDVEIPADLQGEISELKVAVKGPWKNPALQGSLDANPIYRQLDSRLTAEVAGDLEELEVPEFRLRSETLDISGGGSIAIAAESLQLQLDLQAQGFRPGQALEIAAAEGTVIDLDAKVGVSGPWANPELDARIRSGGSYQHYRYSLNGGAAGNLDKITLEQLRLQLFTGEQGGQLDPQQPPPHQLTPQQVSGAQSLLPDKEAGQTAEKGVLPQSQPGQQAAPQQSPDPVEALAQEARQLGRRGAAWLELDGIIEPKAQRANGRVAGRNIPLSLTELAGVELPPSLTGEISIDGEFSGPFNKPKARANVLALGKFRGEPWQLQGDTAYGNGSVELSGVELLWAGRNRLSAEGSLNPEKLDLDVRGQAWLADVDSNLPADFAEHGYLELSATAAGSPQHPQLEGKINLTSKGPGLVRERVQTVPLRLQLEWHTEGRDLTASLSAHHGSRQAIDANARLVVAPILEQVFAERAEGEETPPLPLQLSSSGSADLSAVAEFIDPEIHAMRGQLDFSVDAGGTFDSPDLNGRLQLQNGDYEHRPSSTRLRRIDLLAQFTPDEWRIERARAEDGEKGSISLGGAAHFVPGAEPLLDFQLEANKMHLLSTPAVRGAISGDLALTGTTRNAALEGKLTLRPLSVQIEQLIGSSVPEIDVVEVQVDGPQAEQAPPLMENMALNVQVVVDKQSRVRGLGLDSQLRGAVDIQGTAASPDASGELRIVRGSFDLLGKKFELQEGLVQFENSEAAIYVKGLHEYSEGDITAEISGTTDDLDVTFSSNPAAAQDEIFAQLLFGKSLSDISPLQAVRMVSVVRSLQSGGSVFDPVAKTRELLGVDTLDIEQEDTDEGDQYALSLGKYITNRIYIELQRSTDPLNPWQAEMEIELRRSLNLEVKSAQEGESGAGSVELQWKKDY